MSTAPLVDVTGARRRRARARRRRQLLATAAVVGVLALIGAIAWVIFGSPWLRIADVQVRGAHLTTDDQVRVAAAVPVGDPMATLDTDAVSTRVVEGLPAVSSAATRQQWPRTVILEVVERTPVLVVPAGDGFDWVAADGRVFHHSVEAPPGVLRAEGALADAPTVAALGQVAAALPVQVREQATTLTAQSPDSVEITLRDGRRILWGGPGEGDLKARVLLPLLQVRAKEYDVSAPTHPTTR